jgi:integrase
MSRGLTVSRCERATKKDKEYELGDGTGLFLRVTPSGHRSWLLRYCRPGTKKRAKLTLGPYSAGAEPAEFPQIGDPLTLASARVLVEQLKRDLIRQIDPGAAYARKKRAPEPDPSAPGSTDINQFGPACVAFAKEYVLPKQRRWRQSCRRLGIDPMSPGLNDGTEGDEIRLIEDGLAQRWHDKDVHQISDLDIDSVVEEARTRSIPGLPARRRDKTSESAAYDFFGTVSKLFSWLVKPKKILMISPCKRANNPKPVKSRKRHLEDDEVRVLWEATGHMGLKGIALRVLLLTGQRREEIAQMTVHELRRDDDGRRELYLSEERTKNKIEHTLPLPPLTVQLLAEARRLSRKRVGRKSDWIFSTTGEVAIDLNGEFKKLLDRTMNKIAGRPLLDPVTGKPAKWLGGKRKDKPEPFKLHDIRRTTANGLRRSGAPQDLTEQILNHVGGSRAGIVSVYQTDPMPAERLAALQAWEDYLLVKILRRDTPKVVQLRRA